MDSVRDFFRRRRPSAAEPAPPDTAPPDTAPGPDRWTSLPRPPVPAALQQELDAVTAEHGIGRWVWTERDFPVLGWHDSTLWGYRVEHSEPGFTFGPVDRVALDLDYITRWVDPVPPSPYFSFWVAPVTLVFHGVTALELDTAIDTGTPRAITLADIHPVRGGWHVESHADFDLMIAAAGFTQTFRQVPRHLSGQTLSLAERGGYSFAEEPVRD